MTAHEVSIADTVQTFGFKSCAKNTKGIAIRQAMAKKIEEAFLKKKKLVMMPSAEDRKRITESLMLRTAIESRIKQMTDLKTINSNIVGHGQANTMLKGITDDSIEVEETQAVSQSGQDTKLLLSRLLERCKVNHTANSLKKKLAKELRNLIQQQRTLDAKNKQVLKKKLTNYGEFLSAKADLGSENKYAELIEEAAPCKLTTGIIKFQRVVRKCYPQKKDISYYFKQAALEAKLRKRRKPEPNKLQKLFQKHFVGHPSKKLDLTYIARVVAMRATLDSIFSFNGVNLGDKYEKITENIWSNEFFERIQDFCKYNKPPTYSFDMGLNDQQKHFDNYDHLFENAHLRQRFFEHGKQTKILSDDEHEKNTSMQFVLNCKRNAEIPLPTFAKIHHKQFILSQYPLSELMTQSLRQYVEGLQNPERLISNLLIDDCSMTDSMFANLLRAFKKQDLLKSIIYVNNEIGPESMAEICNMIPQLYEIDITNCKKPINPKVMYEFLKCCAKNGSLLQRLKISRLPLNEQPIIDCLQSITTQNQFLTQLDISWSNLNSKILLGFAQCLVTEFEDSIGARNNIQLRSLNLSYNPLNQDQGSVDDYQATQEFVKIMVEVLQGNYLLSHVDFSGMNFSKDQLIAVSTAAAQSQSLCGVHLSDNGIKNDNELCDDVLDCFGLTSQIKPTQHLINAPIKNPKALREIVCTELSINTFKGNVDVDLLVDPLAYQRHLIHAKQAREVHKNRMRNEVTTKCGIGRKETSMVDTMVLSRKVNQPEMIFNQNPSLDAYFEMRASENWQQQIDNQITACHICHKHKFAMIFYEQGLKTGGNKDLHEITDAHTIAQVKEELNIGFKQRDDNGPIICGTVLQGGYKRKLRMLRCDVFMMLSVCQSSAFVSNLKQSRAIRRGILEMIKRTQNISDGFGILNECLPYFAGWDKRAFEDKCKHNHAMDTVLVNYPEINKVIEEDNYQDCTNYVYAAHLPPGPHQFLIYCPKTQRLFVKDVVIDLSQSYFYPEYPTSVQRPNVKKHTRSNVWRKWREDSDQDIDMALLADMVEISFNPLLFLKDEDDIAQCKDILKHWFPKIQVCHIENLIATWINPKSGTAYPEQGLAALMHSIQSCQNNWIEKSMLPQGKIEVSFIRATRNDSTQRMGGTLCRGEYLELLMRLAWSRYSQPKLLGPFLEKFLQIYIQTNYLASNIVPLRQTIRGSKKLNQLLYDNRLGLEAFYNELKSRTYFDYASAQRFFNPLSDNPDCDLVPDMRACFVKSKMTNLRDLEDSKSYFRLVYVEFLDMICRVANSHWQERRIKIQPREEDKLFPKNIQEEVADLLKRRFALRDEQRDLKDKKNAAEFIPIDDQDEDNEY